MVDTPSHNIDANFHIEGISATGTKYVGDANLHGKPGPDGRMTFYARLISQGPSDNLFERVTLRPGQPPEVELECRG